MLMLYVALALICALPGLILSLRKHQELNRARMKIDRLNKNTNPLAHGLADVLEEAGIAHTEHLAAPQLLNAVYDFVEEGRVENPSRLAKKTEHAL